MLTLLAFAHVAGTDTFLGIALGGDRAKPRVGGPCLLLLFSLWWSLLLHGGDYRGDRVKPRCGGPHFSSSTSSPSSSTFFSLLFSSLLFWAHRYASMASLGVRISVSIFHMLSLICDWADR
jgi:hypothetical protein